MAFAVSFSDPLLKQRISNFLAVELSMITLNGIHMYTFMSVSQFRSHPKAWLNKG